MSGILSLKVYDITSGECIKEFNKGSKFITAIAYVSTICVYNYSPLMVSFVLMATLMESCKCSIPLAALKEKSSFRVTILSLTVY